MTLPVLREDARANITSLKAGQVGFQKYVDDYQPWETAKQVLIQGLTLEVVFDFPFQESFERIFAMYLPLLERLGPRRSDEINSASRMRTFCSRRSSILDVPFR